ncbi:Yip1 family protein [Oceaniglobus ichthyenteri]|uniref:Yip1 family protein n=1 Tax=Oceaniglobus ichthyenteri TaxID=2136177 RepID=UPI000D35B8C7|nr:Yip1 family protein [Oceaniglobus ichthyenteri]
MLNLSTLLPLAIETLKQPRAVTERLIALNLGRQTLWQALALVVILSILLTEITGMVLLGLSGQSAEQLYFLPPLQMGLFQFCLLVIMVFIIFWLGRACGGTGRFQDGLVMVIWLQFIMVCLQLVQTVLMFVLPALGGVVAMLSVVIFMWLLTHFLVAIHGFESLAKTFGMIVVASFGFAFGLSIILALIGVGVPGMEQ